MTGKVECTVLCKTMRNEKSECCNGLDMQLITIEDVQHTLSATHPKEVDEALVEPLSSTTKNETLEDLRCRSSMPIRFYYMTMVQE